MALHFLKVNRREVLVTVDRNVIDAHRESLFGEPRSLYSLCVDNSELHYSHWHSYINTILLVMPLF